MVGLKIDKSLFLDRQKVIDAVGKAEARSMALNGGLVRKIARNSIKKVGKRAAAKGEIYSKPGQPPKSHKELLRKLIYFVYEPDRHNVVIGPETINGRRSDTPEVLEQGGTVRRNVIVRRTTSGRQATPAQKAGLRRRRKSGRPLTGLSAIQVRETKSVTYEPRPFMDPALEKARPDLIDPWADSIKA